MKKKQNLTKEQVAKKKEQKLMKSHMWLDSESHLQLAKYQKDYKKAFPKEPQPDIDICVIRGVAGHYSKLGFTRKALDVLIKNVRIQMEVLPKGHKNLIISLQHIDKTYWELDGYDNEQYQNIFANLMNDLFQGHWVQEEHKQLLQFERFLKDNEQNPNALDDRAFNYRVLKHYDKSIECYLRALKIYEQNAPVNNSAIALILNRIADTYKEQKDHKNALEYYIKALNLADYAKKVLSNYLDDNISWFLDNNQLRLVYDLLNQEKNGKAILNELIENHRYEFPGIAPTISIRPLTAKETTHPVIKAILKKICIRTDISQNEQTTFTKKLISGLEIVIKNQDILAILEVMAGDDCNIDIYKGLLNKKGVTGICNDKLISMGCIEYMISEQFPSAAEDTNLIKFISVLVHESTHLALKKIYANNYEPFALKDIRSTQTFNAIKNEVISFYKEKSSVRTNNQDFALVDNYDATQHSVEIPAWYTQALTYNQFMHGGNLPHIFLVENKQLQNYMERVFKIARLDQQSKQELENLLVPIPVKITMDYLRGYDNPWEEPTVIEIMGDGHE